MPLKPLEHLSIQTNYILHKKYLQYVNIKHLVKLWYIIEKENGGIYEQYFYEKSY